MGMGEREKSKKLKEHMGQGRSKGMMERGVRTGGQGKRH